MRSLIALLCLVFALGNAPPAPVTRLAPDAEAQWVPFTLTPGNQIAFSAQVDGQRAMAILDTGVSRSVMSRRFAQDTGLVFARAGEANAIGGSVAVDSVAVRRIVIGGLARDGGTLSVVTVPANATGSDEPADLLVGQDLIGHVAIDIDYPGGRFRLLPSGRLPFPGMTAPLSIAPGLDLYVSETRLGGRMQRPVMIDTGDGAAVTYSREAWRGMGVATGATTTAIGYGLAGILVTDLTILPGLTIGELTAREVEVRIEPVGGYSSAIGVAGRIGNGLLQHYRVLLDPGAGRMVFARTRNSDAPPLRSTSGVQAVVEPDRLRIVHVMRGSPAEAGGWRSGELICAIDGQPIDAGYAHSPLAHWSVDTPGRVVAVGLCDGTVRQLQLQRFY